MRTVGPHAGRRVTGVRKLTDMPKIDRRADGTAGMDAGSGPLPRHVEETVKSISLIHADHHGRATPSERFVDAASSLISRPGFIAFLIVVIALWSGTNLALPALRMKPFDAPPFPWLMDAVTVAALLIAALIVTTQRRANKLADLREQMTLELGLLNDQKTAKIIALLEELRRDSPQVPDRIDHEAREMATRADPEAVRGAIEEPDTNARIR
jgi:uncharacterized membrane protein